MIDVGIRIKEKSFTGWIQDYTDNGVKKGTIQKVIMESDFSRLEINFDSYEEWRKFIDLFNITDIEDLRGMEYS